MTPPNLIATFNVKLCKLYILPTLNAQQVVNLLNKLEHWYVRHNNVYSLHLWATYFNQYTGHLQALLYM